MQAFKILTVAGLLLLAIALGAVVVAAQPNNGSTSTAPRAVVTDLSQLGMLESDEDMLERMRVSQDPTMNTMIDRDSMWTDPDMVRLQEEYRAQLDRMLANRPGTP